jgi:hypothetical protein
MVEEAIRSASGGDSELSLAGGKLMGTLKAITAEIIHLFVDDGSLALALVGLVRCDWLGNDGAARITCSTWRGALSWLRSDPVRQRARSSTDASESSVSPPHMAVPAWPRAAAPRDAFLAEWIES